MSEVKRCKVTCIVCPIGCEIEVIIKDNKVIEVTGNMCPRGKDYAIQEVTSPRRVVMSVIPVKNGDFPTVSVKTDKPVSKDLISKIMRELAKVEIEAPVEIGEVIVKNVANSGANIVATRPVKKG